jgi:hypothetical protein
VKIEKQKTSGSWTCSMVLGPGRGKVEDSDAAIDGGDDGAVVKEIDLEETEASRSAF